MGLYTVVHIYPASVFQPNATFLESLLDYWGVHNFFSFSVERPATWLDRLLHREVPKELVDLYDASRDDVWKLWTRHATKHVHAMPQCEGRLEAWADATKAGIAEEIADDYLPWDTGIMCGPWSAHDYDTGEVLASGNFEITKSGHGYPKDLDGYLKALLTLPTTQELIRFLESISRVKWNATIELT